MNSLPAIEAVTFDAGGTLFEPWPSVGHVYEEVAKAFGVNRINPDLLNQRFSAVWRSRQNFDYSEAAWFELVRQTFGPLAPQLPEEFFPAVYTRFTSADAWRVFDDVLPVLDMLASSGVWLGVISNWDDRLRPLLANLKLSSYFDSIIISCDIGFTKPSPIIFEETARQLGVAPSAVLHVGDSLNEDFAGAVTSGMKAALLDRSQNSDLPHRLSSLKELEFLIATK